MAFIRMCVLFLSASCCVAEFADPAKPRVNPLAETAAATPAENPALTVHGAPKPLPAGAITSDWPCFLGPTHNAVSSETKLLRDWPTSGPTLIWEMRKGTGYSAPTIKGDYLLFQHRLDQESIIECIHPVHGQRYWQLRTPCSYEDRYGYQNGPRASCAISDDDLVYAYGVDGHLLCLRLHTGQILWQRRLNDEFKVKKHFFGTATSPLIDGKRLIINVGAPGGPSVIALDRHSGALIWGAGDQWGPSYASPVPAIIHGKPRVFVFTGGDTRPPTGGLLCIDPANGDIDFRFPWRSRKYESVNASNPVLLGNAVFISASYQTGGAMLDINAEFAHTTRWTSDKIGTHWNTPVVHDGVIFAFDGRHDNTSDLVAVDAQSGAELWRETYQWESEVQGRKMRLGLARGSLLKVDGDYLCLGEFGHLTWMRMDRKACKVLDRALPFVAQQTWSPLVLSRGLLYVCQNTRAFDSNAQPRILCYDLRAAN
jgi:outer membrane protein assembly factor BamB